MDKIKHFVIGVVAVLAPGVPAIIASPAIQDFVASHPTYAVYFPVFAGVIVAVFHKLFPTATPITEKK
jgi:zinc transporter ZupT